MNYLPLHLINNFHDPYLKISPPSPLTKVQCSIVPIVITPTFPSSKLISQQVLVNDAQTTTIIPIHVASETNKEWRNSQSLDNEKEGKAHYYHLHLDPKFFFFC